ncbi:hypothetical protein CA237_06970 [Sphingomonas sp. ABOLH]|nr:MAG: hypothetical protein DI625_16925 [Sphingomonas sp.]RSV30918.1 hypothetical protein CA237_06970 [Sphingomonas sp. ABOLH]
MASRQTSDEAPRTPIRFPTTPSPATLRRFFAIVERPATPARNASASRQLSLPQAHPTRHPGLDPGSRSFFSRRTRSGTPDQVRGDEKCNDAQKRH